MINIFLTLFFHLVMCSGRRKETQFVIETEAQVSIRFHLMNIHFLPEARRFSSVFDQMVDYVGRLMYSCLDWGLGADVERELDETLELLVDQMTKVDIRLGADRGLQPISTLSEVLQVQDITFYPFYLEFGDCWKLIRSWSSYLCWFNVVTVMWFLLLDFTFTPQCLNSQF